MTSSGTIDQNKDVIRRMIASGDAGDFDVLDEVWSPDIVVHFGATDLDGEAARALMRSAIAAFPDLRHEVEDLFAAEDKVVLRGRVIGTHQGEFEGIAATGKTVETGQIVIYRLKEGRVVEYWEQADFLSMMQQLGAIPS